MCLGMAQSFVWMLGLVAAGVVAARGADIDVLTWHNDLARTGQNLSEVVLTPANVNSTSFGKLFFIPVDGQVYAQPLLVSALSIPGVGLRDVVYAATEHDTVYACDADTGAIFWQRSMLLPGETPSDPLGCGDLTPELGITATPVIDRASGPSGTIYVVAMSKDATGNYFQRLHALDLASGAEELGGPVSISASYPGIGDNSVGGNVIFDPRQYLERAGLVLSGGVIYTTWASHCDTRPYTAWVIGFDETNLTTATVLNLTPNGNEGAIWSSGAAPAVDSDGFIYAMNGNGTFETTVDANGFPSLADYGNCFVKLRPAAPALEVADFWTPSDTVSASAADVDLGSGGPVVLPDMIDGNGIVRHLAVGAGKDSHIYIVDRDNMGKFDPSNNGTIYQDLPDALHHDRGEFGAPAYFNGRLYFGAVNDFLKAFDFANARLTAFASSTTQLVYAFPGTTPSISANGTSNGIVWTLERASIGVLHAYDATDVGRELYNSGQGTNTRDQFGTLTKFSVPTVANGKVYVGATTGVAVFGLLPTPTPTPTPIPLPQLSPPIIAPGGGTYKKKVKVTLSANAGQTTIRYTTDGTDPSGSSILYLSPFKLTSSVVVKAKAMETGYRDSAVTEATFTIGRKWHLGQAGD